MEKILDCRIVALLNKRKSEKEAVHWIEQVEEEEKEKIEKEKRFISIRINDK